MKAWRPYWKHLEEIQDALLKDAGPTPFGELKNSSDWIARLPFVELTSCDLIFRGFIEDLEHELERMPYQTIEGASIRWQMILRVECGLTFCRGHLWKRKEFDWSQPREVVYRWLLIELWYQDAVFWASRVFGSDKMRKAQILYDIRSKLWQLAKPKNLEAN